MDWNGMLQNVRKDIQEMDDRIVAALIGRAQFPSSVRPVKHICDQTCEDALQELEKSYFEMLPKLCISPQHKISPTDLETKDESIVQLISERLNLGIRIIEAKLHLWKATFKSLVEEKDSAGILERLTVPEVEKKVLERVRTAVQENQNEKAIDADLIVEFFEQFVIPLCKKVQVCHSTGGICHIQLLVLLQVNHLVGKSQPAVCENNVKS